jgi:hypothetical protein
MSTPFVVAVNGPAPFFTSQMGDTAMDQAPFEDTRLDISTE